MNNPQNNFIGTSSPKRRRDFDYLDGTDDSLWWDSQDVQPPFTATTKSSAFADVITINIDEWHPYQIEISEIINLINTRCLIHTANISSFNQLCNIFDAYASDTLRGIKNLRSEISDVLSDMKREICSHRFRRSFHMSGIFSPILRILQTFYEIRRRWDTNLLNALRHYIVNAENYLNFQSKCLLDCLYQIEHKTMSPNFRMVAIRQWMIPSQRSEEDLDRKILEYQKLSLAISKEFQSLDIIKKT